MSTVKEFLESAVSDVSKQDAVNLLEGGHVLLFSHLPFELRDVEKDLLNIADVELKSKNISYDINSQNLRGLVCDEAKKVRYQVMMDRFARYAIDFVDQLFPQYKDQKEVAKTSFRPIEAKARSSASYRKDDQRLHVDAFPSNPNQGRRILRVFSNINPAGEPRVWRVGDELENLVSDFHKRLKKPFFLKKHLLKLFKVTKSKRTDYDALMLQLHDKMKADLAYQKNVSQKVVELPAGSTWAVFTDQASHAVVSGQYCLEQTFYLPIESMQDPAKSPLKILEKQFSCDLV